MYVLNLWNNTYRYDLRALLALKVVIAKIQEPTLGRAPMLALASPSILKFAILGVWRLSIF